MKKSIKLPIASCGSLYAKAIPAFTVGDVIEVAIAIPTTEDSNTFVNEKPAAPAAMQL